MKNVTTVSIFRYISFLICTGALLTCSCSFSEIAMGKLTDSLLSSSGATFTGDDDPELIGDALPFTIKLYESLLEKDSTNAALYLATAKLVSFYSQYFIAAPLDTMQDQQSKKVIATRAKKLFLRARQYSLKSLELSVPGTMNLVLKGPIDSAMKMITRDDITPLFWSAASWLGAIGVDRSDLSLALAVQRPLVMMKKVVMLDSTYDSGSAHELLAMATINLPPSLGGGVEIAERYFKQALSLSERSRASTLVLYAASVPVKRGNLNAYTSLLNEALSLPIQVHSPIRVQNILYQQKARILLTKVPQLFPDTAAPQGSQ